MIEAIMEVPTDTIKKIPASWDKDRPDTGYLYNAGAARYRDRTGKFISNNKLTNMRNEFIQKQKATVRSLANDLQTGKLTRTRWSNAMRKQVNQTMTAEYLAGKGGASNMTKRDYNILENSIKQQYEYLNKFEQQIKKDAASVDTAMSEERIAQRSELYMENTKKDFERAKVEARGMPNLPQYPGDGRTICGVNCKCTWDIKFVDGMWHATWRLHPAEHCPDCLTNSTRYNPYIVAATRSALMHELEALV
tara:strand:- start:161 stop:910 length:750 start_codon:yes stop_codon:yes gene_type:complete